MKRAIVVAAVLAAMLPALAQDAPTVLTEDGLGSLKIGMDIDQMERVLHTRITYNPYQNHGCSLVTTKEMEPRGISLMIEAKHLSRIGIDFYGTDPRPLTIKTDNGIGLRSTEAEVLAAYGARARVVPNAADPTWHTIYVESPDRTKGVVFETNGHTVKSMRAGANPAIATAIGCR